MRETTRDERRRRIVQAAREAFASSGFDNVAMAGISKAAGMAAGTLYNYFPSKESLLVAVFEREIAGLVAPRRAPKSAAEWARSALRRYAAFPRERWREFMAAFYRGSPTEGVRFYTTQAPLLESLGRTVNVELGSDVSEPERLRRIMFSTFYQGFLRWLNAGKDIEEVAREVAGDLDAILAMWNGR